LEIIYIMALRQMKLFYRSRPRVMGSIAQPTLFLLALGLGFGPVFEQAGGVDYVQYLTPGIIGMSLLFGSMMHGMSLIWDKKFGFLKETLVAPVSRIKILIGRCLGGAITSILQGIIVFTLSYLLMGYQVSHLASIPLFISVMLLIALLFSLLGTVIAAKVDDMEAFPTVTNFLILPMFFLSGAIFPISNLPSFIITITRFNPMTYGVNLLRGAMDFQLTPASVGDVSLLIILLLLLLFVGNSVFQKIET